MRQQLFLSGFTALSAVASLAFSHPLLSDTMLRRSEITPSQVKPAYDYVVVGGGQSGLVVAARLSEDPSVSVLVVEYGLFATWLYPTQNLPTAFASYPDSIQFNLSSTPAEDAGGFVQDVYAACCVGGGSQINGMLVNRGSPADYDAWERLGNPGWGWDGPEGMFHYFKKGTRFVAPDAGAAKEFGMKFDPASYGDGPIENTLASWQWPGLKNQYAAADELGVYLSPDAGSKAYGIIWYPQALDNATAHRSYGVNGYWEPNESRPNLHILTAFRVDKINFSGDNNTAESVTLSERVLEGKAPSNMGSIKVKANKEVVLAAGAVHTPQILMRSGIGPKAHLEEAGVAVLVDLPGVGANLQDHPVTISSYNFTKNLALNPDTTLASNPDFAAWAGKELRERGDGPLRIGTGNMGTELPLSTVDKANFQAIVDAYKALDVKKYLPADYNDELVAGYEKMREILADLMTRDDNAFIEIPMQAAQTYSIVLIKVLSRGTLRLNTTDVYAEPVMDYNTIKIPQDKEILMKGVKWLRKFHATKAMSELGPVETLPGPAIATDEQILSFLTGFTFSSIGHNSGTAMMAPRKLGGVVDAELRVYGIKGLRVVDASIMPIIPGAHTCATVYAVAEKAADIIKKGS